MPPRNTSKRARKKKGLPRPYLKTLLWGAGLSILLGASLAATFYFVFLQPGSVPKRNIPQAQTKNLSPPPQKETETISPTPTPQVHEEPAHEDSSHEEPKPKIVASLHPRPELEPQKSLPEKGRPRVAIIIDDMGNNRSGDSDFIALDLPLSFAFLPEGAFTKELAGKAAARGHNVLLHLPMEAENPKWNLGAGGLRLAMSRERMSSAFLRDLAAVPGAIGINNHMGSRFTEDRAAMETVLNLARRSNLFFVDSFTSSGSVGHEIAQSLGMKSGRRDVFLDNVQEKASIIHALDELVQVAKRNGHAIAIGHPHPATFAALREAGPGLRKQVDMAGVRNLVQ